MNEDRLQKRRAHEAAQTYHRAFYERYYPTPVLGGRRAEPVTPEVLVELERLKVVAEEAKVAWEAARRP